MGKSPGKWLKNLLSRKKSKSKKAGKVEVSVGGEASPCLAMGSQVISHPLPVSISNIEEKGLAPNVTNNGIKMPNASENSAKLAVSEFETSNGREEKAAIRVQTVIRGHEVIKHFDHSGANMSWQKTSAPAFICKFLCSKPLALALQMQYAQGEPNSVWDWLEREKPNPKTNATEYERSKQNLIKKKAIFPHPVMSLARRKNNHGIKHPKPARTVLLL